MGRDFGRMAAASDSKMQGTIVIGYRLFCSSANGIATERKVQQLRIREKLRGEISKASRQTRTCNDRHIE